MSDTPRTDEEEDYCSEGHHYFVPRSFAKELETELAAIREELATTNEAIAAERYISEMRKKEIMLLGELLTQAKHSCEVAGADPYHALDDQIFNLKDRLYVAEAKLAQAQEEIKKLKEMKESAFWNLPPPEMPQNITPDILAGGSKE